MTDQSSSPLGADLFAQVNNRLDELGYARLDDAEDLRLFLNNLQQRARDTKNVPRLTAENPIWVKDEGDGFFYASVPEQELQDDSEIVYANIKSVALSAGDEEATAHVADSTVMTVEDFLDMDDETLTYRIDNLNDRLRGELEEEAERVANKFERPYDDDGDEPEPDDTGDDTGDPDAPGVSQPEPEITAAPPSAAPAPTRPAAQGVTASEQPGRLRRFGRWLGRLVRYGRE